MLARRPHRDLLTFDLCDDRVRLHCVLVDGREGVLALDDEVGSRKYRLQLAAVDPIAVADVALTGRKLAEPVEEPRPEWAFVQDRRVVGECLLDRPRDRELLVLDTDRIQGRLCRGFVLGRDRRHRLAGKAHMVERDDRAILDRVTPVGIEVGEIVTGEDADDAGQRLGLARVDGHHSGMGERRPQDLSVHHPRHDEVADELRGPPELLVRVPPWNRAADVRERLPLDDGHSFAPASSATASTIPW